MDHPYKSQPERARWSLAVARSEHLSDMYRKKFDIGPEDRIATAGSCFAQHLGRRLAKSGFNYQDYEPAPPMLAPDSRPKYGYGLFSARYGNVYTTRQLLQMFKRARGRFTPQEDMWEQNGRFFDPFRPNVEPNGFASEAEFRAVRETHFASIMKLIRQTDVFVFTLGLTEAWMSKQDGAVFPVCPGTIAGQFDPDKHVFRNFNYLEIRTDLESAIANMRNRNPDLRIILTVSPVPLAATATQDHVLAATVYSKSVLRAVAGDVANGDPLIDYFPSYEIVTNPKTVGSAYEPNFRDVREEVVDVVMSHFFAQHPPVGAAREEKVEPEDEREDLVCEEAIYDRA